jgi:hypothetical protein
MIVNPKSTEVDGPVCNLLIKQIGRPKNLVMCKAMNVYDNRWRINVYTRYMVDNSTLLEGNQISYSCFATLNSKGDKLEIIDHRPSGLCL